MAGLINNLRAKGQGITEYAIIVALVAVSALTAFSYFGGTQRNQVAGLSQEVAGQSSEAAISRARRDADRATIAAAKPGGMGHYDSSEAGIPGNGGGGAGGGGGGGIGIPPGGIGTPPGGGDNLLPPGDDFFLPPGGGGMCPIGPAQQAMAMQLECGVPPDEPCSDAITEISTEVLQQIFNSAAIPQSRIDAIADELNAALQNPAVSNLINTKSKMAHFLSQVQQEVGPTMRLTENLNYTVDALKSTFSYFRANPDEAELYGRKPGQAANQEAIANRAYGNRYNNGDIDSGDGWRYRGRGMIQLTFRANYETFTTRHNAIWQDDFQDFIAEPELLAEEKYAVRSALLFWQTNNLATIAEQGVSCSQADAITAVVNLHTSSYAQRCNNLNNIMNLSHFELCPSPSGANTQ
ncbi:MULTISPECIES: hypothetical protein [Alkalimonas]|uniref:Glycoside hydrolase family 19 catalytic domain-containing protein n=1 Tax=Alkalimonas mucilaginosa TaxID=3057676 RepID=A0ABU7JBD1_9GAMM|nr:hypothetical protein [Alkalimonas sp. MEB004]MEE2022994.1 hypothetical protein [Alkalimonas sp. MEB004]